MTYFDSYFLLEKNLSMLAYHILRYKFFIDLIKLNPGRAGINLLLMIKSYSLIYLSDIIYLIEILICINLKIAI
jgi:hypothetical protein